MDARIFKVSLLVRHINDLRGRIHDEPDPRHRLLILKAINAERLELASLLLETSEEAVPRLCPAAPPAA